MTRAASTASTRTATITAAQPARAAKKAPAARTAPPARTTQQARPTKSIAAPVKTVAAAPKAAKALKLVAVVPEPVAEVVPIRPRRSTRRASRARQVVPVALGSLTQPGARQGACCQACGSTRVTSLTLTLTDGTPVEFTSCHACEHRSWYSPTGELDRATVLDKTRKLR